MAAYRRGIYISEVPTSIVPPVAVDSAMPVFFVTAPVHLTENPYGATNVPTLCYSYKEAVDAFGFSLRAGIWDNYTAPEAIYSQFVLYGVAPMVMVNVLDPKIHCEHITGETLKLTAYSGVIDTDGVLIDTVKVKKDGADDYTEGIHYTLSFNSDGFVEIHGIENASDGINKDEEITLSYTVLSPEKVDIYDIIGGYDSTTGKNMGLELVSEIYPRFGLVPGQIAAPKYSADPAVAAVMETKASNINGHFKCIALNDIPTFINDGGADKALMYTDAPAWKKENGYVSSRQYNCYPKVRLSEQIFDYSAQMAGLICKTDSENSGVPYNSPSNKNLKINGLCDALGNEMIITPEQANYLNGQGIVTAINFTKGYTAWGNRTGAYPGNTDVKDSFISVRRMFDWIANTIVLTHWNRVDFPLTKRVVNTIRDSVNIWLNGLAAREFILGGRAEFIEEDNPDTNLIDGIVTFRVKIAPPPPMKEAEFILEYDPAYLRELFS